MDQHSTQSRFSGPTAWAISAILGLLFGISLARSFPSQARFVAPDPESKPRLTVVERSPSGEEKVLVGSGLSAPAKPGESAGHAAPPAPHIPWFACLPFAGLLGGIALLPFLNERWWHRHYPDVSLFLGGVVVGYYLIELGAYGRATMLHTAAEYYSFFALVGGLYVASGGILVDIRVRATPGANTLILLAGAVLANIVGTTGASMLLIRPFMRINAPDRGGRLSALHVVFFIFIVSNCGGCLTPIGDPPLYLGYLKGVPFQWTLSHLWPMWLVTNGFLLAAFFVVDTVLARGKPTPPMSPGDESKRDVRVFGLSGMIFLALIVGAVFVDPMLKKYAGIEHVPVGATLQVIFAAAAYFTAPRHVHQANGFTFAPAKEVGLLFAGIFATMAPALAFLDENAPGLGLTTPTQFYFATGMLSAGLDNAPTYLSFLQIAFSVLGLHMTPDEIHRFIEGTYTLSGAGRTITFKGGTMLEAISLGAVFFGAATYIGNGPNFMVKAIAEARGGGGAEGGLRMPSFFGYALLAAMILGPALLLNWLIFIR